MLCRGCWKSSPGVNAAAILRTWCPLAFYYYCSGNMYKLELFIEFLELVVAAVEEGEVRVLACMCVHV